MDSLQHTHIYHNLYQIKLYLRVDMNLMKNYSHIHPIFISKIPIFAKTSLNWI